MRNDSDPTYNVRDATGDPTHPMFEEVCELVLDRARTPREDHPDTHIEQDLQPILDRHGEDAVREVMHTILVDGCTFRTAATRFEMDPIEGILIGNAATRFLDELSSTDG